MTKEIIPQAAQELIKLPVSCGIVSPLIPRFNTDLIAYVKEEKLPYRVGVDQEVTKSNLLSIGDDRGKERLRRKKMRRPRCPECYRGVHPGRQCRTKGMISISRPFFQKAA
ncbi:hypothetical protein HY383_01895 [Candidatus Daviesbacteria bacterium]|nr:hypothetical protein [Candidatus Daviesbacteria bacterium]